MYICVRWFDISAAISIHEKISSGLYNSPSMSTSVIASLASKIKAFEFISSSWTFSLSTDWSMLYAAIGSVYQFLSSNDAIHCARIYDKVLFSVATSSNSCVLNNRQFFLLFYLATFTYDLDADLDFFYKYWTHGRGDSHNMQHTMHFRRRHVAYERTHSAYFISKFDANLWYDISVEIATRCSSRLLALLLGSLYYISFVNTHGTK